MLVLKIIGIIFVIFGMGALLYDSIKKLISRPDIKNIKSRIKDGSYDWKEAIEDTADKIIEYPESLLWQ